MEKLMYSVNVLESEIHPKGTRRRGWWHNTLTESEIFDAVVFDVDGGIPETIAILETLEEAKAVFEKNKNRAYTYTTSGSHGNSFLNAAVVYIEEDIYDLEDGEEPSRYNRS